MGGKSVGCIRKGQEGRVYLLFPQYPQLDTFLGDTGISTKGRGPKHGSCHSEENKFGAGYSQSECSSGLGRRALQKVCVTRSWLHRQNVQWGLHFFFNPFRSLTAQTPSLANRGQITSSHVCFTRAWGLFVHLYLVGKTISCPPKYGQH